jgi:hypothetical protein
MDRASLIFWRTQAAPRTDDFEDTVPNTSVLTLSDRPTVIEAERDSAAHWRTPWPPRAALLESFGRRPPAVPSDVPQEDARPDFQDTVPFDLSDELSDAAMAASCGQNPRAQSGLFFELDAPSPAAAPARTDAMPAHFKRQALGPVSEPGLGLARPGADNTGSLPGAVLQSLVDCEANDMSSDATTDVRRPAPSVSSKTGRVHPVQWTASADGDDQATEVALPNLRRVGIADLRQVSSHVTTCAEGATRHIVRFRNGGFVRFAYGADESVVELSGERITVRIGVQGDVLITALAKSSA